MSLYRDLNSYVNRLPKGVDKLLHIVGGLLLCLIPINFIFIFALSIAVGFGKELLLDKNYDLLDALAWPLGAIIGGLIRYAI